MSVLSVSSQTVVTSLGHLFESDTISAKSLQPYLSDINNVHRSSDTSGLTSNPANREIVSSSGTSEHQDIFFLF
jgi:hypothetical protein